MSSETQPAGWSDERVELLKKLWMEGLSASQIAGQLGDGVTRNAVIGKVHRLKLSARAKPQSSAARPRPAQRPPVRRPGSGMSGSSGPSSMGSPRTVVRQNVGRPQTMGATALATNYEAQAEVYVAPNVQELFIPEEKRLTLLQLNEHTCKWPIGDPMAKDFHFCGGHSRDNSPYCEFHSRRAYHQVEKKKRS